MALTLEVVKPLGNGNVQVDAKNKIFGKEIVSSYMVSEKKADEFIADYKKENKKRTLSGIAAGVVTCGMIALGGAASKKAGVLLKAVTYTLFAVAGLVGSVVGFGVANAKRLDNIFKKNDARPLVFLKEDECAKVLIQPFAVEEENKQKDNQKAV